MYDTNWHSWKIEWRNRRNPKKFGMVEPSAIRSEVVEICRKDQNFGKLNMSLLILDVSVPLFWTLSTKGRKVAEFSALATLHMQFARIKSHDKKDQEKDRWRRNYYKINSPDNFLCNGGHYTN